MTRHAKHIAACRIAAALGHPAPTPQLSDAERRILRSVAAGHTATASVHYRILDDLRRLGLVEKRAGVPHVITDAGRKMLEVGR